MEEKAKGIILRVQRLTESSLIVKWLTPEFGRLSTVAKGALRAKSPFQGKLDLYYQCAFNFSRSRKSELHTLREVQVMVFPHHLRTSIDSLEYAACASTLIERTTETEVDIAEIYNLFASLLDGLAQGRAPGLWLSFEFALLQQLGLAPTLPENTRKLVQSGKLDETTGAPVIKKAVVNSLNQAWRDYLGFIPKRPAWNYD